MLAVVVVWATFDPAPLAVRTERLGYPAAGGRCHARHRRDNQAFEAKLARIGGHVATFLKFRVELVRHRVVDLHDVFESRGVDFGQGSGRRGSHVDLASDHVRDEAGAVLAEQLDLVARTVDSDASMSGGGLVEV